MATVASVYQIEKFVRTPESVSGDFVSKIQEKTIRRPRPKAKRVWASLEKAPEKIGTLRSEQFICTK